MEEILAYSDEQLIAKLKENGLTTGPLTSTTKRIYAKKLYRKLNPDEADGNVPTPPAASSITSDKDKESPNVIESNKDNRTPSVDAKENVPPAEKVVLSYFAVQLPDVVDEVDNARESDSCVFDNKVEALKLMKKIPGSRFKVFSRLEDAKDYSQIKINTQSFQSPKPNGNMSMVKPGSPMPSEGSAFKGPKSTELATFRKIIESNDVEKVKTLVWSNPRYLISSVDTPTVLHEGFHYNALHVTGSKNLPEICKFILDTVENMDFLNLLYPSDTAEIRLNRMSYLVDFYLNTPDSSKGNCETPLHFACKFGHPDVVEVLTSHPKTDRYRLNKYGESPAKVVCSRARGTSTDTKNKILDLLEDRYYVPLMRVEDNSAPAKIAEPWSPSVEKNTPFIQPQPEISNCNGPTEAARSVRAYAGPMSPSQAEKFRRRWQAPPSPNLSERKRYAEIRRSDSDKGYERIGRNVAQDMRIPWSEYWHFLGDFTDLSTEPGLQKLESYLKDQAKDASSLNKLNNELESIEDQFKQLQLNPNATDILSNMFARQKISDGSANNNNGATLDVDTNKVGTPPPTQLGQVTLEAPSFSKPIPNSTMPVNFSDSPSKPLANAFLIPQDRRNSEEGNTSHSSSESYQTAVEEMDQDYMDAANDLIMNTPAKLDTSGTVFILGDEPSKTDVDVLRAVEGSPLTPENHPLVHQWRSTVLAYSEQARKSWKTPIRNRATRSTPRRLVQNGTNSPSKAPESSPLTRDTTVSATASPATDSVSSISASSVESSQANDSFRHVRTNLMSSFAMDEK